MIEVLFLDYKMMKKDQEHRFWCRFCNKGFASGNCLGGHMRGHLALISAEKCGENCDGDLGFEEKTLFGHMRCHPKQSKVFTEFSCEFVSPIRKKRSRTLYGKMVPILSESCSHVNESSTVVGNESRVFTEFSCEFVSTIRKKRSRTLYRKMVPILSESCSHVNESSTIVSNEIDEITEAATCLMMMSRDYKGEMIVADDDLGLEKLNSSKKSKLNFELEEKSCDGYIQSAPEVLKDSGRNSEFKCRTCDKVFHSIQALNGHQRIHSVSCTELKVERCGERTQTSFLSVPVVDSQLESAKNLLEKETGMGVKRKSNCYECSTCFKVFKSGQALGGHMRAHYSGPNESKVKETMLMDLELPHHIDIPAILKGVRASDVDLKPWWTANNQEFEPQQEIFI